MLSLLFQLHQLFQPLQCNITATVATTFPTHPTRPTGTTTMLGIHYIQQLKYGPIERAQLQYVPQA